MREAGFTPLSACSACVLDWQSDWRFPLVLRILSSGAKRHVSLSSGAETAETLLVSAPRDSGPDLHGLDQSPWGLDGNLPSLASDDMTSLVVRVSNALFDVTPLIRSSSFPPSSPIQRHGCVFSEHPHLVGFKGKPTGSQPFLGVSEF